jgi:cobalt/nickel transport system permease protein
VGSVVTDILLGPWAACLTVTLALVIQALLFGDGGITALAANCLTMAVVMPFVGWYVYRLMAGETPSPRRQTLAAALAGYVALNVAALYTAVLLGIQPLIARGVDGRPLYAPYPLSVAVSAMAVEHLLLFGVVEAAVAALVIASLRRTDPALVALSNGETPERSDVMTRLWSGLGVLTCLTPLGVILPAAFNSESAWGEWSPGKISQMVGYLPVEMGKLAGIWKAPLLDYTLPGIESAGLLLQGTAYVLSAVMGIGITVLCLKLWARQVK